VSGANDHDAGARPPAPTLRVLFCDEHIVAVSKPSGMLVHKAARAPHDDVVLLQTLKAQLGRWLYPVQRLDRATSGVITFAFSSDTAAALQRCLAATTCRKEYLVLVRGTPPARFVSQRPLTDDRGRLQPAHTTFRTLLWGRGCALVRARIHTGRSNQIRRHLNHLAHHALGDTTFGKGRLNAFFRAHFALPRLFLHATRLCLRHPTTGARLRLRDRLPDDLGAVLRCMASHQRWSRIAAGEHQRAVVAQRPLPDEGAHALLDQGEERGGP
jgi:tRNA pseudouridine65 synthase